jgi:hypothetical protein
MITKILVAAAIAGLAGASTAAPAFADPGSFGDLSCSCQAPAPQAPLFPHFFLSTQDPIDQGFQQGLLDANPDATQR